MLEGEDISIVKVSNAEGYYHEHAITTDIEKSDSSIGYLPAVILAKHIKDMIFIEIGAYRDIAVLLHILRIHNLQNKIISVTPVPAELEDKAKKLKKDKNFTIIDCKKYFEDKGFMPEIPYYAPAQMIQ